MIKKIWHDPVWSKVIASFIYFVLLGSILLFKDKEEFNYIYNLLNYKISIWISATLLIVMIMILTLTRIFRKTVNKLKPIPDSFDLDVLNESGFEITVITFRKWYPDNRPSIETFINNSHSSRIRCGECKSEFYNNRNEPGVFGVISYYTCSNSKCNCKKEFTWDELNRIKDKLLSNFQGMIRNNYDYYWNCYKNVYLKYCNGKPNLYLDPK